MQLRSCSASRLRGGSCGAGPGGLLPTRGMLVPTDGFGSLQATEVTALQSNLSLQRRRDYTWRPAQGIVFHKPTPNRSCSTQDTSRDSLGSSETATSEQLHLSTASSEKPGNSHSPHSTLPYSPRRLMDQRAGPATEQKHTPIAPGLTVLGKDCGAGNTPNKPKGKEWAKKDHTWKSGNPVNFDTNRPKAILSGNSPTFYVGGKTQITALPEELEKLLREVEQVRIQCEPTLRRATMKATLRQWRTWELHKKRVDNVKQVAVRGENFQQVTEGKQAGTTAREQVGARTGAIVYHPDKSDRGINGCHQSRPETLRRSDLAGPRAVKKAPTQRIPQEIPNFNSSSEGERPVNENESASDEVRLQSEAYKRFKKPFGVVLVKYNDLSIAFKKAIKECSRCGFILRHMLLEIEVMKAEYNEYAHQFRSIANLRRFSGAMSGREGSHAASILRRRRVRHYRLTEPFMEQLGYARVTQVAFSIVETGRLLNGLNPIFAHRDVTFAQNMVAITKMGRELVTDIEEQALSKSSDIEKELGRVMGPYRTIWKRSMSLDWELIKILQYLARLGMKGYWWNGKKGNTSESAVQSHRNFRNLSSNFHMGVQSLHQTLDEAELEIGEELVERHVSNRALRHDPLSSTGDFQSTTSRSSHHSHPQTLNIHATATLNTAWAEDISTVRLSLHPSQSHTFDPAKQRSVSSDVENQNLVDAEAIAPITNCAGTAGLFQISEGLERQAALAASPSGNIYWQYTLYQGPDGENVKVHYCKNKEASDRIAQLFLDKPVIGFDIEWKAQASAAEGTKKNVSLIQLASEERIALFHIARFGKDSSMEDLVPPTLKKIMETPEITKVGVAVKADCTRLRKFMGIDSRGLLELSHLYKLVKFSSGDVKKINKSLVSLAQQVEEHLLLPMWKGEVRSSDWSEELNFQQIQYAASDSYAGLQLYHVMEAKRKAIEPTPPCPAHAELNLPIRLANGQTVATYNEPEEPEEEALRPDFNTNGDPLPEVEQMARDFLNITIEDVRQDRVPTSTKPKKSPKSVPAKSLEFTAAEAWIENRRSKLPDTYKPKATAAYMRAYAIWHDQEFDVQETASLLRNPPLQVTTVSNYILEAIRLEKLPYDINRLKDVLGHLPESVSKSRYPALRRHLD